MSVPGTSNDVVSLHELAKNWLDTTLNVPSLPATERLIRDLDAALTMAERERDAAMSTMDGALDDYHRMKEALRGLGHVRSEREPFAGEWHVEDCDVGYALYSAVYECPEACRTARELLT